MYTEYPQLLGALRTIRAEHPQWALDAVAKAADYARLPRTIID